MRFPQVLRLTAAASGILIVIAAATFYYAVTPHTPLAPAQSPEGLLQRANTLSWGNRWAAAEPLYAQAEVLFARRHEDAKALYAKVSRIPPNESVSVPAQILGLTADLSKPGGQAPETRLRILTIRGMLETNYDAQEARSTWQAVENLALHLHHYELASRAIGEQGIAAFLAGDTVTAKKQVVRAWELSKIERDPAATVRYASVFGAGLVQLHRYREALGPLNQAIQLALSHRSLAYPSIAVYAKIDALAGMHRYQQALGLANQSLSRLQGTPYDAHKAQVYTSRGQIYADQREWAEATADFQQAINISDQIHNFRGATDSGGLLARAYLQEGQLPNALTAINAAIEANTHIPDELYLVPRNLSIKAEIVARMGNREEADILYSKSVALVNEMIQHAPIVDVQRYLLAEMSDVYSGYFASLCAQKRYDAALALLEQVRGRTETEALEHHADRPIAPPTPQEQALTQLNIRLINAENPAVRKSLLNEIYATELSNSPSTSTQQTIDHPVPLEVLQHTLSAHALLIEYVLAEPNSYALAITRDSVQPYRLASKTSITADATRYRKEVLAEKEDVPLAQRLFTELLAPIEQYKTKPDLIIVPDGEIHLLPFSALADPSGYVLKSHTIDIAPSSTVFALLENRANGPQSTAMPYIGVAAWTQTPDTRNPILRAVLGPERSELVPLPDSREEVETIGEELPHPSTILLGASATESRFKQISSDSADVIHLALHGYVNLEYPDRSALIFAPEPPGSKDDGLLQVREIRNLHLKAKMVTLSACDTGVGPVGDEGVANIVNAFIDAGADTVVSTLWSIEDHATEHLMTQFYAQLDHHESKGDALRAAQLEMVKENLPPYYWASFQIVGDANGFI